MLRSGIEAGGDPVRRHVVGVGDDLGCVGVVARERVPVGDEVEAVVLVLERRPVLQRADEMPEMELTGRAHAGDNARFHRKSKPHMRKRAGG